MKVQIQFQRASTEVAQGLGGDRDVFMYDLDVPDNILLLAECHHARACGTVMPEGHALPSRPCPLKPMSDVPHWMCVAMHDCRWRGNNPASRRNAAGEETAMCPKCQTRNAVPTPDNECFALIQVTGCVGCEHAGNAVIGSDDDRSKVTEAFKKELAADVDLSPEDIDYRRWEILWSQTQVVAG